jgi:hypothetical protein
LTEVLTDFTATDVQHIGGSEVGIADIAGMI